MELRDRVARLEERMARLEARLGEAAPPTPATPILQAGPAAVPSPASPAARVEAPPTLPWAAALAAEATTAPAPAPAAALPEVPVPPPAAREPELEPAARPVAARLRPPRPQEPRAASGSGASARLAAAPSRSGADLERFLGVAVLGRVGVAALLLAAAYFAQLAYKALDPTARVASIYGLSAVLVGAGFLLRRRVGPRYVAILWGGGVAAAYLAGVAARLRYGLVGPLPATAMLVGACALGQDLARRARLQALALVALAGAFAAPVLVGSPEDHRTTLLVYLLTLHAWAAWTEGRWGWAGARLLALVCAAAVALAWLVAHGAVDGSTLLHVHLYLLGLSAPEWGSVLLRREVPRDRIVVAASLLGAAEAMVVLAAATRAHLGPVVRDFPVFAALAWLALAVGARARRGAPDLAVRALTRLGGSLLVAGAVVGWVGTVPTPLSVPQAILASLAVVGTAFVLARPWLGCGDGLAAIAALLAVAWPLGLEQPDPWDAAAFAAPVALLLAGGSPLSRVAGLALAAAAPFLGFGFMGAGHVQGDPRWLAAAFGLSAALLVAGREIGVRRKDPLLPQAAEALLAVLVPFWVQQAADASFLALPRPLANPGTAAAALVAVALAVVGRPRRGAPAVPASEPWLPRAAMVALLLAAGWREVHDAVGAFSAPDLGVTVEIAYLATAGTALLGIGRRLASTPTAGAGLAVLALGAVRAAATVAAPGAPWTAALDVALIAAPALLGVARSGRTSAPLSGLASVLVAVAGGIWVGFLDHGRFGVDLVVVNVRFLAGAGVVAALVLARRASPSLGGLSLARPLSLAAVFLAFGVGLVEVLDAVRPLGASAWRSALVSVYATLFSAAVLALGFRARSADLRWLALLGFAATVVKIGLHDLASLDTPFRILITGCLGVVLLLAAYAYARRERLAASEGAPAGAPGDPPESA